MAKEKQQGEFVKFTLRRGNKVLFVRPREIAALSAYEEDESATRLHVKEINDDIVVQEDYETVLNTLLKFEQKGL